ncbi:MaoC family dehydratase N-terminal domain-containing protein [Mycobacterium sp. 21AC1]|uniref:MaoC/PaaZ C-terminal domain-containing protein n=1 Tax=[Mycobacterium] appelbergii TaxID=2939269 RepID=UPI002938EC69|nr:MaoC/PaaZ C-terminal domain-containing protein [Mycobacterium sp. 21AC1]MDV3127237.1 MaoC family dehydratase N-terminal domain-containing protein [Mycobacterium sp. 21AC1]
MAEQGIAAATVGREVAFTKTVGESDVYLFAGITGDLSPNHVDESAMSKTRYGRRIAHGALLVGFMSNTSTQMISALGGAAVSYGYNRVRFIAPVFIGDTITVTYTIREVDRDAAKTYADVNVRNVDGAVVAAAEHILYFLAEAL